MNRVVLTKEEARWLSRNLVKTKMILEAASKKDAEILERSTYKVIKSLNPEAVEMASILDQLGDEPYEFEIMLKEKQKKVLHSLVEKTIKSLSDVLLPAYERKNLPEYTEDTKRKIELLKIMVRKFR